MKRSDYSSPYLKEIRYEGGAEVICSSPELGTDSPTYGFNDISDITFTEEK